MRMRLTERVRRSLGFEGLHVHYSCDNDLAVGRRGRCGATPAPSVVCSQSRLLPVSSWPSLEAFDLSGSSRSDSKSLWTCSDSASLWVQPSTELCSRPRAGHSLPAQAHASASH